MTGCVFIIIGWSYFTRNCNNIKALSCQPFLLTTMMTGKAAGRMGKEQQTKRGFVIDGETDETQYAA